MKEGYKKLLEKDALAFSLLSEQEKKGEHLRLLFVMAHPSPNGDKPNEKPLNQMKGFDYLREHLDDPIDCDFILGLFGAMLGKEKGEWKKSNNYFDFGKAFYITLPHDKTPEAMEDLCRRFAYLNHSNFENLDDIFLFILHFICIHPLQNGNGRVSAFLLQILLYKAGFKAAIYLPLDALMNGLYRQRTSLEIRRASGSFYGRKELDLTFYAPYMMELLEKSYGFLIEALQDR